MSEATGNRGTGAAGALLRYAPSRFVEPLLSLISLPILTRLLGAEQYGVLSVLLLTGGVIRNVSFDWLGDSALRYRSVLKDDLDRLFTNVGAGLVLSTVATAVLLVPVRELLRGGTLDPVAVALWWVFADAGMSGFARSGEMVLRATHRPVAFTVVRVLQGVVRHLLAVAALLLVTRDLPAYFAARVVGLGIVGWWAWLIVGGVRHTRWRRFSPATQVELLKFGAPLAVALLAGTVRIMANRYVVMGMAGPEATGLYTAAANIGGAPLIIFQQIVMLGLYPLAIDAWEQGRGIVPILRDGLRYFILFAVPALVGMALLARPILEVVAGASFGPAAPVLAILAGAMFIYGLSQYFSLPFMVTRRTGLMAVIGLASGVLNVGLSLLLVGRYGYQAAAWATLAANVALLVAMVVWGLTPWRACLPWRATGRAVLAAVVMAAVVLLLGRVPGLPALPRLVGQVVLGAVVYGGVLAATGEVSGEWNQLRHRLGRGGGRS